MKRNSKWAQLVRWVASAGSHGGDQHDGLPLAIRTQGQLCIREIKKMLTYLYFWVCFSLSWCVRSSQFYSSIFFPSSAVKKKTRELIGYSFARRKWNVQDPGSFPKSWYFDEIWENFQKNSFFCKKWRGIQREPNYCGGSALRVLPAETRLTVYRRLRVRLRGPASWNSKKNVILLQLERAMTRRA